MSIYFKFWFHLKVSWHARLETCFWIHLISIHSMFNGISIKNKVGNFHAKIWPGIRIHLFPMRKDGTKVFKYLLDRLLTYDIYLNTPTMFLWKFHWGTFGSLRSKDVFEILTSKKTALENVLTSHTWLIHTSFLPSKWSLLDLKMMVKSGTEKFFLKFLHAGDYFSLLHKNVQNLKLSNDITIFLHEGISK